MKLLMAANWKMHKTRDQARETVSELVRLSGDAPGDREVLIIPPFTSLEAVADSLSHGSAYHLGAQNFYPAEQGAYTGEVSPDMLLDVCCEYALAGHSERRHVFGESDSFIAEKVAFGLDKGLKMILCLGETLDERKNDQVEAVLTRQLESGLKKADAGKISGASLAVAYEPVWAIGTGETAETGDIKEAHDFLRQELVRLFPQQGPKVRILYGGSVKPGNASEIVGLDNVEGVLVGGASLQAESFSKIVLA
jgi:triosephosphate isomerase